MKLLLPTDRKLLTTCWLWLLLLVSLMPGCGGCRNTTSKAGLAKDETKDEKEKDKIKPDFQSKPAVFYPGVFKDEAKRNRTKPGHWVMGSYRAIANNFDASGRLSANGVGTSSQDQPIPGTSFIAQSVRPVSLPKEQEKNLEMLVYLPKPLGKPTSARMRYNLTGSSGLAMLGGIENTILLRPYQYHFVILAKQQDEYAYLSFLDFVQLPLQGMEPIAPFYHMVFPTPEQPLPLGPSALSWTTIAYVLWDNLDADKLSSNQQQALLDWLHFGGQLIINGPGSMTTLQQSFLAPYLPATFGEAKNISDKDLGEFNRYWSTPLLKDSARRWELTIPESAPMLGVDLKLNPDANYLAGTGQLVAEKRVGRGRITMTGFPLNDKRFPKWECASSFFHNALLGKPHRNFSKDETDQTQFVYEGRDQASIFNPMFGSTLRFISRDLGNTETTHQSLSDNRADVPAADTGFQEPLPEIEFDLDNQRLADHLHFGGFGFDESGGTGTWNDSEGLAAAARENISQLAGINPPAPAFVLKMLGIYLVVLVPLNWLLFRLLGRVEWAWIAMPVIAIGGAYMVVRMASLDIGFLRSQSQIGVLELPANYSRGHLTEYSALYTSLSTIYSINFEDQSGLALPFGAKTNRFSVGGEQLRPVQFEQRTENRANNILVNSNSTGMLHQEAIAEVGGVISIQEIDGREVVRNDSQLKILEAGVVRRTAEGIPEIAWLGRLAPNEMQTLSWKAVNDEKLYDPWLNSSYAQSPSRTAKEIWNGVSSNRERVTLDQLLAMPQLIRWADPLRTALRATLKATPTTPDTAVTLTSATFLEIYPKIAREKNEELNLGGLFDVITKSLQLAPGEVRLLGHTTEPLTKSTLEPRATQVRQATLIVVHLRPCPMPPLQPDVDTMFDYNLRSDLDRLRLEEEDNEQSSDKNSMDDDQQ